ncbi:MAG: single-stranded DNA-binding protein [Minisyncoccia bacterium]
MYLNKVFLIGNLTRDVTLRNTPSGQPVADFGLATTRVWSDHSGQKRQETDFHNVIVWGKMAELCSQYLSKGRLVFVEGRIRNRSWVDQNGIKRYRTEIIAENIKFGPRREGSEHLNVPSGLEHLESAEEIISSNEELPENEGSFLNDELLSSEENLDSEENIKLEDIPF